MEVIKKGTMPDGTKIQIENWMGDYPSVYTTYTIAAYPILKQHPPKEHSWLFRKHERIRYELMRNWNNNAETEEAFEGLCNGTYSLKDFENHVAMDQKWITDCI